MTWKSKIKNRNKDHRKHESTTCIIKTTYNDSDLISTTSTKPLSHGVQLHQVNTCCQISMTAQRHNQEPDE